MRCQLLGKSASEGLRLLMRSPVKNVTHGAACSEDRLASTLAVVTLRWGFDLRSLCKRRICLAGEKRLLPRLSLGRSMAMSTRWCTSTQGARVNLPGPRLDQGSGALPCDPP